MGIDFVLSFAGMVGAWLPVEVFPWSGVLVLTLLTMDIAFRTNQDGMSRSRWTNVAVFAVGLWVLLGLTAGWDRSTAGSEIGLFSVVAILVWYASKQPPTTRAMDAFSLGISLLSLWALWQVLFGLNADLASVSLLPERFQEMARQKILTGRAFAGLVHPGHLAALLATIVPLGINRVTRGKRRSFWIAVLGSCFLGIALTRSLLGAGLAVLGIVLGWQAPRKAAWRAVMVGALAGSLLLAGLRPDTARLEPVRQRIWNWKAAIWVWEGAPIMGVGVGGFGRAALSYPGMTANHPQHAHCLPLEWASEMGLVGLALALVFFVWIARVAAACRPVDRGLAGAVLIVPIHNLLDFSLLNWGVAIPWAVMTGWGLAVGRGKMTSHERSPNRWSRAMAIGALSFMVLFSLLNAYGASLEQRANHTSSPEEAILFAERARSAAPWRVASIHAIVRAARDDPSLADRAIRDLEAARWWRPHSPALTMDLAMLRLVGQDLPGATREAATAAAEAPPGSELQAVAEAVMSGR